MNLKFDRNTIYVYYCHYQQINAPQLLAQYHCLLNLAEQQRWTDIRSEDGKLCFLIGRSMIRTLLSTAIGCTPSELILATNAYGKPLIEQPSTGWQFNLSHSQGRLVLALAYDADVGVDIECHRRKTDILALARHCFHPREIQQLEAMSDDKQTPHFFKLWTLKEAYIKALGHGLSYPLDSFGFSFDQTNSSFVLHPLPHANANCWSILAESDYTLAIITLSPTSQTKNLKLYPKRLGSRFQCASYFFCGKAK